MNAPKLCPAEPVNWRLIVSSGSPSRPQWRVTSEPSIVPTVRFTFRIGSVARTGSPSVRAGAHSSSRVVASSESSTRCCWILVWRPS